MTYANEDTSFFNTLRVHSDTNLSIHEASDYIDSLLQLRITPPDSTISPISPKRKRVEVWSITLGAAIIFLSIITVLKARKNRDY